MGKSFLLTALLFTSVSLACQSAKEKLPLRQQASTLIASIPKVYAFTARPIWADEFDTPGLPDPKIWSYDVGGSGWGNNELQYYTEADQDNVHIEDGLLTIEAYIDGKQYFNFENSGKGWEEWPFDKKQHILLNLAIGGNWGGQKGVDDSIFPNKFVIDYVRVYGLNP